MKQITLKKKNWGGGGDHAHEKFQKTLINCRRMVKSSIHSDVTIKQHLAEFYEQFQKTNSISLLR